MFEACRRVGQNTTQSKRSSTGASGSACRLPLAWILTVCKKLSVELYQQGGVTSKKRGQKGSFDNVRHKSTIPPYSLSDRKLVLQSSSLVVCEVDESLKDKLTKFRFRKETNNAAILMKIDTEKQLVILEEEFEDISLDDLREELPEHLPRFIAYSYKYVHDDGRVSYPLCFIFSSPMGCKPELQMMYAGSKTRLVQAAELTKVFETRQTGDLTEEWLKNKLAFFH